jgi:hypothetical protein
VINAIFYVCTGVAAKGRIDGAGALPSDTDGARHALPAIKLVARRIQRAAATILSVSLGINTF